jgi:hypothetical protein
LLTDPRPASAAMDATETLIDALMKRRPSIEQAHADLVAKFSSNPHPELARMIGDLELEIADRSRCQSR